MQEKMLPEAYDYLAPDGSEIRGLVDLDGSGGLAHCLLPTGQTSKAHRHETVGEIWYFLRGNGQVWRRKGDEEKTVKVSAGYCLTIEAGTDFQFRNTGTKPLTCVVATIPSWPGPQEATPVEGPWEATPVEGLREDTTPVERQREADATTMAGDIPTAVTRRLEELSNEEKRDVLHNVLTSIFSAHDSIPPTTPPAANAPTEAKAAAAEAMAREGVEQLPSKNKELLLSEMVEDLPPEPKENVIRKAVETLPSKVKKDVALMLVRSNLTNVDRKDIAAEAAWMSDEGQSTYAIVQIRFSKGPYDTLRELASRPRQSMSTVLRDALAFEKWYRDTTASGNRVFVEDTRETSNKRFYEVKRP